MNPFGKPIKQFLQTRGFTFRGGAFYRFFSNHSLLFKVSFPPVRGLFERKPIGYTIGLEVFYPLASSFFLVSPCELSNLRRDGTLRHVCYVGEHSGVYEGCESEAVLEVLGRYGDYWVEKLVDPVCALEMLNALRTRTPFPKYLEYLQEFVANDDREKIEFARRQVSSVYLFDGGINFDAYIAFLNSHGKFEDAKCLIERALQGNYFIGVRHAPVSLDETLEKLLSDAEHAEIVLSARNVEELKRLQLYEGVQHAT